MADVEVPSLSLPGGVAREGWKTPAAPRSTLGYVWDQGVGVAQGAIDILQTPVTLARDIAVTEPSTDAAAQAAQHVALDTKNWLERRKTSYGQELTEKQKAGAPDERGIVQEAGEMVVGTAAPLAAAAATGPLMPLTFGALSVGASGLSAEEQLRNMSEEDLLKTPVYSKFRRDGMDDGAARRATYHEMRTLQSMGPDFVANAIFGGYAARLVGKAFSRTVAGSMRDRIMRSLMQDVPEGIVGGAVSGAATDFSRQAGQVQGGLRDEIDWGQVQTAGIDVARPAGVISSAVGLGRGIRRPASALVDPGRRPADPRKILGDTDKATPEIGTDLKIAAEEGLGSKPVPEEGAPPSPPPPPPPGGARAPINPEGSTARVAPEATAPVAPVTPAGGGPRFRDFDAVKEQLDDLTRQRGILDAALPEQMALPEWKAESDRLNQALALVQGEHDRLTAAGGLQKSTPEQEAALLDITVPPEAKPTDEIVMRGGREGLVLSDAEAATLRAEKLFDVGPDGKEALGQRALERVNQLRTQPVPAPVKTPTVGEQVKARASTGTKTPIVTPSKAKAAKPAPAEAPVVLKGEKPHPVPQVEALRLNWIEHQRTASAKDLSDPAWQAENDRLYGAFSDAELASRHRTKADLAREAATAKRQARTVARAVAVEEAKAKAKPKPKVEPVVTPASKAEPEEEIPEPVTPSSKVEEKVETQAKAEPKVTKVAEGVSGLKSGLVKGTGTKTPEQTAKSTATKQDQRDRQKTRRESEATAVVTHALNENERPEWDAREVIIREGKVEDVFSHIEEVTKAINAMVNEYIGKIKDLQGGNRNHDIYQIGGGATGKARGQHGQHHSFLTNLFNRNRELQDLLKIVHDETTTPAKKADAQAAIKDIVVDFLDNYNLVREGKISDYSTKIAKRNAKIETDAKTNKASDPQVELIAAKRAAEGLDDAPKTDAITDKDIRTTKPMTKEEVKAAGFVPIEMPTLPKGRGRRPGWSREETVTDKTDWVGGREAPQNLHHQGDLRHAADLLARDLGRELNVDEFAKLARKYGEKIERGTLGDVLSHARDVYNNPIQKMIFDAVHKLVKDIPVTVWSRDAMEAFNNHHGGKPSRGMYSYGSGEAVFRRDALVPRTIFHEAIHAATSRAIDGSQRLKHLIGRLQDIIEDHYRHDKNVPYEMAFQKAIRGTNQNRIAPQEFVSELFTRPEVEALVKGVTLKPKEAAELTRAGYKVDTGKSLLKNLWNGFLEAIGFKAETPNAYKMAVDMLQDMFEREAKFQARDTRQGNPLGVVFSKAEIQNLARQDPVLGREVGEAIARGDHDVAASKLMDMAHKITDESTADKAIEYLKALNEAYYGRPSWEPEVADTTMPTAHRLRTELGDFMGKRFGTTGKNLGFHMDKKFGTLIRHVTQGIRYTNDLGNNLEEGFRKAIQPLKDAWSKREHFAQEYMDKSGANLLIDDMARLKNMIRDRELWNDFERLLIRESYARAFADEELGVGRNLHINTGDLRDRQSVKDHAENRVLWQSIADRSPALKDMRNRIHDFMAKEMESRQRYQTQDMLLKWNIVKHGDDDALEGLAKNVMRLEKTMTPAERAAVDRIIGTDPNAKAYKDFEARRTEIRAITDDMRKSGPHVPFMRHGNHVVYAEYHVRPKDGVKYNEVKPDAAGDLHKSYDFVDRGDAGDFIDNVLSHEDIQITVRNAEEVVYDTSSGERAAHWVVEKPDKSAKTYGSLDEAEAARGPADKMTKKFTTAEDVKQMADNGQPVAHYEVRHRVTFNPVEYVRFENEREAHEYREYISSKFDTAHTMGAGPGMRTTGPHMEIKASHVESPKDDLSRANVAYTTAEMQRWVDRIEASPTYQNMTKEQQGDWKRLLKIESARVTATAGRRTMMMPRDYAKGASTNILKNTIDFAGNNARANADLKYRDAIDKGRQQAHDYTHQYRYTAGDHALGKDHRARQDVLAEFDRRLFAPPRVEDSWATGIKRALQVSMISHLADTGYLMVNALEPWIFGAAITASRHGMRAYSELGIATKLVDPGTMAKQAFGEFVGAAGEVLGIGEARRHNSYEGHLLAAVTGPGNARGDGTILQRMLRHMFSRGLVARDVGMEMERIHDPSKNWAFRKLDNVDAMFRAANTGVETVNRAAQAISNFRLEYDRAVKEGKTEAQAYEQALRYAEDIVFKGAGDYGTWNNPRYMNNPFIKLAGQFKKYPLRITSVWVDAMIGAARGDREKQKQIAFMLVAQALAGGAFSSPLSIIPGGMVNAAYLLGMTDDNFGDMEFAVRQGLVDMFGVHGADLVMHGALDFTGANFSSKFGQASPIFFGDPESRDPGAMFGAIGKTVFGAPGDSAMKFRAGIENGFKALEHFNAGANEKGWQSAMEASGGLVQIKALHNIIKAVTLANTGPPGMPAGNEASTLQAIVQGVGFTPTEIARKQEEKRAIKREIKKESTARNIWVNRWRDASNPAEQSAIWRNIQQDYNAGIPDKRLHITQGELFKAKQRKKREEKRDDTKLGIKMSGRQKAFADIHNYFSTE